MLSYMQYSSGQAEGPLARIKALVTDSMYILPPVPRGNTRISLPLKSHIPFLFPTLGNEGDRSRP